MYIYSLLYSLAATCVRLLTGCFPQSNSNLPDSVYDVDQRRWLWQSVLKSQKRSISDFWANILNKMLEDKSSQRYQSASEVLTALNNLPSSRTVVQPTTVSPPPQRKISTTSGITRRKWLYNSIGMIVFGAVIALVIDKRNAWLKLLPATSPSDFTEKLPGGLQLAMVELPGGKFMMGSPDSDPDARDNEKPQHQVQVNSFAIGKYPVTQAQYEAVMGTNPSHFKNNPPYQLGENHRSRRKSRGTEKLETDRGSSDHRFAQFDLVLGFNNYPRRQLIIIPKIL